MNKVQDADLKEINGGFSGWALAGLAMAITFAAGVIDGIARPKGCKG